MIKSFGNPLAHDIYNDLSSAKTKKFPPELYNIARRKLFYLNEAEAISDLKVPPGNRLEFFKGDLKGYCSIRINNQWRIIFTWSEGDAHEVTVLDYHK
jgi:proteic killer suppression protein